ncbi:MAG: PLP-dependent aminotransferase family protein [Alphaproteobacteria bacterium]|nr:PLP-dependent aminotransferase family protein [Alphaproteobacteria bacterium]MDE2492465.1 PLP-dependent aminotransferase family protein [Alphaproteobacteria bacterium]
MNLPLQLDRDAPIPLQDQLVEQLRQLILTGKLKANSSIIGTRFLAEQMGVSRRTVLLAYERLISEGYLETRPAVGTFVCSTPPDRIKENSTQVLLSSIPRQACLRPTTFHVSSVEHHNVPDGMIDFDPLRVDTSHLLPPKVWLHGMRNVFAHEPDGLATAMPAAGAMPLRRVLVDYLAATRGIMAAPEQVVIIGGRRQACSLVAHLFQHQGDRIVVESPGDEAIAGFFQARGAELIHVPVDEQGLETDRLPDGPVSLAYVTPVRQNPIGGTMPHSRRVALIEWARQVGAYLIEDDSDSEFRYHGATPQPLAALDPYGLTFYTGSFAKTLGAGLGLGYLVVPSEFVETIVAIKSMADDGCPWLEQMVVADLLTSGEYDHHLRRVRKIYLERRDCLVRVLRAHFGDVRLIGAEVGTQLTWLLTERFPSALAVCNAAWTHGVNIERAIDGAAETCRYRDKALIFGFAALTPEKLQYGIARLSDALRS